MGRWSSARAGLPRRRGAQPLGTAVPRWSLVCCAVLVAACGGASGASPASGSGAPSSAAHPVMDPLATCVTPEEQAAAGVAIQGAGGTEVDALVRGSGTAGIVFANMSDNDPCGWLPTAGEFAAKGYRTAVFLYSGRQGADADVLDVVAELRRRGSSRIVLVGASKGGTAALTAAGRAQAVAVAELSAPSLFEGMDAGAAVPSLRVPTWFAVGEQDEDFVQSAHDLYAASASTAKHLEVVASASHGTGLLPDGGVSGMIGQFVARTAPAAG